MTSNADSDHMGAAQRRSRKRRRAHGFLAASTLIAALVIGNLAILTVHVWAKTTTTLAGATSKADTHNLYVVDDKLIRGGRPTEETYRYLAENGVTTVVDLRAEEWVEHPTRLLQRLGIEIVSIPMRDGQAPTEEEVDRFLAAVRSSEGKVYVHCMAGVGRTGTMVAAYLVRERGVSSLDAIRMNLAVGPPSLEQITFASGTQQPDPLVTAVSRVLDAPRRIWTYVN